MSAAFITRVVIANSFTRRLFGLMGRTSLPDGEVWVFPRCRSVHTGFMHMTIDVVFLGAGGTVIGLEKNVGPWRILRGPAGTAGVMEAGTDWLELQVGDTVPAVCGGSL